MMNKIDMLVEKYTTGFKKYGKIVDVFENPDRKEMHELGDKIRWIADGTNQIIYIWNAFGAVHGDVWVKIKKQTGDVRPLYRSGDLITGVKDGNVTKTDAIAGLSSSTRAKLKSLDWSWASRWVDVQSVVNKL